MTTNSNDIRQPFRSERFQQLDDREGRFTSAHGRLTVFVEQLKAEVNQARENQIAAEQTRETHGNDGVNTPFDPLYSFFASCSK